jgi:hypothetical protein
MIVGSSTSSTLRIINKGLQIMAIMLGKIYDALIAAGAPEDKARSAAEELASYDSGISEIKLELSEIKADIKILRWAVTAIVALLVPIFIKIVFPS